MIPISIQHEIHLNIFFNKCWAKVDRKQLNHTDINEFTMKGLF